jgi:hypothetical protein
MSYSDDHTFSTSKDKKVKEFLETKLHWKCELIKDAEMQKEGIDMVVNIGDTHFNVDNKHIRGTYTNFYLETESCPRLGSPGWLTKEDSKTDYVFYIYWEGEKGTLYAFKLNEIREWFNKNQNKCWKHQNKTSNATIGWNAPITEVEKDIKVLKLEVA